MKRDSDPGPGVVDKMTAELREWLQAEDIPNRRTDDHALQQFLHGCKFRMDRAKFKMKNYLEMRRSNPEWFAERDPTQPALAELLALGVFLPLPRRDEEGRYVILVRATINNPRTHPMVHVFKVGMMIVDLIMEEDMEVAKKGVTVVIDLDGVGFGHSMQMTPGLIKKAVHSWQDCYPVRIKSIVFVNCPIYVNVVLNIFRQFMRDKLRRRVQVLRLAGLRQAVGQELLPLEYGGSCGPLGPVIAHWAARARDSRDWFLADVTVTSAQ